MLSLVSLVFTLLMNRKKDQVSRFGVLFTGATVLHLPILLHVVLRLPTVMVVVEGHHVRGELVHVPGHDLHTPDVKVVVVIKSGAFC